MIRLGCVRCLSNISTNARIGDAHQMEVTLSRRSLAFLIFAIFLNSIFAALESLKLASMEMRLNLLLYVACV